MQGKIAVLYRKADPRQKMTYPAFPCLQAAITIRLIVSCEFTLLQESLKSTAANPKLLRRLSQ
jgi:hypothetical protein